MNKHAFSEVLEVRSKARSKWSFRVEELLKVLSLSLLLSLLLLLLLLYVRYLDFFMFKIVLLML